MLALVGPQSTCMCVPLLGWTGACGMACHARHTTVLPCLQIMLSDMDGKLSYHHPADGHVESWCCADFTLSGFAQRSAVRMRAGAASATMHASVCTCGRQRRVCVGGGGGEISALPHARLVS